MPARQRLLGRTALPPGSLRVALARLALPALVIGFAWGMASSVSAQRVSGDPLARADRAFEGGRMAEAGRAYEDAIAAGGLDPEGLARASLRLGIVCALGSEDARAERHFANALALAPTLSTPEGLSDALRARFEALREAREGHRARIVIEVSGDDEPIGVAVRDAPPGLARTIEIEGADLRRTHAWDGERIDFDVPVGSRPVAARALDAHGNVIASAGAAATSGAAPSGAVTSSAVTSSAVGPEGSEPGVMVGATGDEAPPETPLIESPWLWIAVGVVAIAVGVVVGVTASGDRYVLNAPVVR